jgi:hypothetical protein
MADAGASTGCRSGAAGLGGTRRYVPVEGVGEARRRAAHAWLWLPMMAVLLVLLVAASTWWLVEDYFLLVGNAYGFQWTERYGTILECGGRRMLLTRMRHMGASKYVPVLRFHDAPEPVVLWEHAALGFNPTIFCMDNRTYLVGSPNVEWNLLAAERRDPAIRIAGLMPPAAPRALRVNLSSCIERYFDACALDGKFSVVAHGGCLLVYIRANTCATGGGRHVQRTASCDADRARWTPFEAVDIAGVAPGCEGGANIYFFDVAPTDAGGLRARFPMVVRRPSGDVESGIYESHSADGLAWSAPRVVRRTAAYDDRTTLHPVGLEYFMRINLHLHAYTTELLHANGSHAREFDSPPSLRVGRVRRRE